MNEWQGYVGPFDSLKEQIISIFEERAGLSPDMAWTPKIANVFPIFLTSRTDPFTYDKYRMTGVEGEIENIEFKISFGSVWERGQVFTQDPGFGPHFHFHSISRIQIPGKILDLFRGYPEYYIYTGENEVSMAKILDLMIFYQDISPLVLAYKPKGEDIRGYYSDEIRSVQTELVLYRQKRSRKFPLAIPFGEIFKEWEIFFLNLIEMLKSGPVMTKHLVEAK